MRGYGDAGTRGPMSKPQQEPGYIRGGWKAHYILFLLSLAYLMDYADRMVIGSLFPFIKMDWGLSDSQLGSFTSVIYLTISVFVLPASLLIDRWSRRKMISIMVGFWSLATLACAHTRNYGQLLFTRALIGLGEAGYAPGGTALIAAVYPKENRARAMGIWNAAIPVGAAIGFLAGGIIGKHWGWQTAFGLVSVPGFILAVLFWFIRDYQTVRLDDPQSMSQAALGVHRGFSQKALELFRIRSLWFTYLGFAMNTFITTAVMTWLPSYFHRYKGFPMDKSGAMTAVVALAVLVGAPLGGFLADHWMKRRANARMTLSAITSVLSGFLLFLAFLLGQTSFFLPLLILFGTVAVCYVAPSAAVTQDVVHPGLRALSYGLCVVLQHVLGGAWSPMIVGALSDSFGLADAMRIIPVFALLGALCLWAGSRTYAADAARAKQVELATERGKNG